MRILYYGESPCIVTGLSQVSRYILDRLHRDGHDIQVVAMNHFLSDYDHIKYPYPIDACHDNEGRNTTTIKDRLLSDNYDIFLFSADLGGSDEIFQAMEQARQNKAFVCIVYVPVDCDIIPASAFNYLAQSNVAIVYTEHGKQVAERIRPDLAGRVNVIGLGTSPDRFFPLPHYERERIRKNFFRIDDDTFLVLNINRNQHRKDLGRSMMIFHEFHRTCPQSKLYLHSKQNDIGGSLPAMALSLGMKMSSPDNEVIFTTPEFSELIGCTSADINLIYNAADCLISTSTGEGWGLSTTEAMCAGLPVIVPRNTANIEIVGAQQERGYLVKAGGDIDHMIIPYGMSNNPRDIVHSKDMLRTMKHLYHYRNAADDKVQAAMSWCHAHTWNHVADQWSRLIWDLKPLLQELQDKMVAI